MDTITIALTKRLMDAAIRCIECDSEWDCERVYDGPADDDGLTDEEKLAKIARREREFKEKIKPRTTLRIDEWELIMITAKSCHDDDPALNAALDELAPLIREHTQGA